MNTREITPVMQWLKGEIQVEDWSKFISNFPTLPDNYQIAFLRTIMQWHKDKIKLISKIDLQKLIIAPQNVNIGVYFIIKILLHLMNYYTFPTFTNLYLYLKEVNSYANKHKILSLNIGAVLFERCEGLRYLKKYNFNDDNNQYAPEFFVAIEVKDFSSKIRILKDEDRDIWQERLNILRQFRQQNPLCQYDPEKKAWLVPAEYYKSVLSLAQKHRTILTWNNNIFRQEIIKELKLIDDNNYNNSLALLRQKYNKWEEYRYIDKFVKVYNSCSFDEAIEVLQEEYMPLNVCVVDRQAKNNLDKLPIFCEGRYWENRYKVPGWWCQGNHCLENRVYQHNDIDKYTLYDFIHILGLQGALPSLDTKGYVLLNGNYIQFMSILNWFNLAQEHLYCQECGGILEPYRVSNYHAHAITEFKCDNPYCTQRGIKIYLNHCFNCGEIIDSRETKQCPNERYICKNCGICCSNYMFQRKKNNDIKVPTFLHPHWEWAEFYCPICGERLKIIKAMMEYKCPNDDYIIEINNKYYTRNLKGLLGVKNIKK